jgi:hypothetical protein
MNQERREAGKEGYFLVNVVEVADKTADNSREEPCTRSAKDTT